MELNTKGLPVNWSGDDWDYYKTVMLNVFVENDLEDTISNDTLPSEPTPTEEQKVEHRKKQAKVKRIILGILSIPIAHRVMKLDSGTTMWRKLCEIHEGYNNPVLIQQRQRILLNKLWSTKMEKGANASEHLQVLFDIREKLAIHNYGVHDLDMVEIIRDSLPDSFEFIELKRTVRYATVTYTSEYLKELIMIADGKTREMENRHNTYRSFAKEHNKEQNKESNKSKEHEHKSRESKRKNKPTYERVCYKCQEPGHIARFCQENKGSKKHEKGNESKINRLQSNYTKCYHEESNEPDSGYINYNEESNEPDSGHIELNENTSNKNSIGKTSKVRDVKSGIIEKSAKISTSKVHDVGKDKDINDLYELNENNLVSIQTEDKSGNDSTLWYWDAGSDAHVMGCIDNFITYQDIVMEDEIGRISGLLQGSKPRQKVMVR